MKRITFIGLFLFVSLSGINAHDIHISIAEINIKQDHSLEVSLRIFFDDLLFACGLKPGEALPDDYSSSDDLIRQYVEKHFKLFSEGTRVELVYRESYTDNMAVWIELEANELSILLDELTVENTILLKEFDDQLNILNWNREQKTKSVSFTHKKRKTTIQL